MCIMIVGGGMEYVFSTLHFWKLPVKELSLTYLEVVGLEPCTLVTFIILMLQ